MQEPYVLGLDLDGTCADFYGRMRHIAAEWVGESVDNLDPQPIWGLTNWGLQEGEYDRLHRFAVTQRDLFRSLEPLPGALKQYADSAQKASESGSSGTVSLSAISTKRQLHKTIERLDYHAIPYWDLCLMRNKGSVGADLYVEDFPSNIQALRDLGHRVLIMDNPTNRNISDQPGGRGRDREEAEVNRPG